MDFVNYIHDKIMWQVQVWAIAGYRGLRARAGIEGERVGSVRGLLPGGRLRLFVSVVWRELR